MPTFNQILKDIGEAQNIFDITRRRYLEIMHGITNRNIIVYYSSFLQKQINENAILERDKNGFMAAIHKLDKTKGLDLLLHTPGGDLAAAQSIISYIRKVFGNDIRVFIPQISMSAGTMMALASQTVVMGKQSSIGPIDPQIRGESSHGILDVWDKIQKEINKNQLNVLRWQPILAKYSLTYFEDCKNAIDWSRDMTVDWLCTGMFAGEPDAKTKAEKIVNALLDHSATKSHGRPIDIDAARELGIKILELETDQELQDAVMSVHHSYMLTFERTPAFKIIENHIGVAHVLNQGMIIHQAIQT